MPPRSLLILASTLALGCIAGFFYTYEVSVMRGFARLSDADFITAMQSVNATIRNWAFAPSFFGAALLMLVTSIVHAHEWRGLKAKLIMISTLIYALGGVLLTLRVNVPMNEWLASQGPAALLLDPGAIRAQYESNWVFWNLVRAINSGIAFALMAFTLWLDGLEMAQP